MKAWLPPLALTLCASVVLAEPPPASKAERTKTDALVKQQVVKPLEKAQSKRKAFSRVAPTPVQRRVRVLDTVARVDAAGRRFLRFAVDVHRPWREEGAWGEDEIVGCAYPDEKKVFVEYGERYFPAAHVVSGDETAQPGVCRVVPPSTAQRGERPAGGSS